MIESLLTELADTGWTISWAYQWNANHWRVSIVQTLEWNGYDQPDCYRAHCADAPTFAEALEDAMSKRSEAEFVEGNKQGYSLEPKVGLIAALGLRSAPIRRRV